jgi:putative membrane protein
MLGTLLGILLALVAAAVVIFIVGRLNLGMTVDGFGPAIIAAAAIAIIGGVIYWLLGVLGITIGGGWLGAIINLIIAAIVLLLAGRWVKGLKVNGFVGAIIAAIAIGVVTWLINWLLGLLGLA